MIRRPLEERTPMGVPGLSSVSLRMEHPVFGLPFGAKIDLADCLVVRPVPFRLVIWEELRTKAPAPPKARPHCCYIQTVIFYHSPHIVRPFTRLYWANGSLHPSKGGFEEWDQIQYRLGWDDRVAFDGEEFEVGGGGVVWAKRRWWVCHKARRAQRGAA